MTDEVRVLVVDDLTDAADMLAAALETDGYVARTATDGYLALQMAETFQPHAVVLDVNMPGMNGRDLTAELRQRYGDSMVLIAVSGVDPDDECVRDTFETVDHYFRKPVDMKALRRVFAP